MNSVATIMTLAPVIPVLVIDDVTHAIPIAEALVAGGLRALEVTLRTSQALEVIRAMSTVEGAVVGAGTVLSPKDLDKALEAGAGFIVSPGLTEPLGRAAISSGTPFLPGVSNAGDIMRGLDLGFDHFKFFPAASSGGLAALKSLIGPFSGARFCPTGGITLETAPDWLSLPEVLCVGGSWLVQPGALDCESVADRARAASAISCEGKSLGGAPGSQTFSHI